MYKRLPTERTKKRNRQMASAELTIVVADPYCDIDNMLIESLRYSKSRAHVSFSIRESSSPQYEASSIIFWRQHGHERCFFIQHWRQSLWNVCRQEFPRLTISPSSEMDCMRLNLQEFYFAHMSQCFRACHRGPFQPHSTTAGQIDLPYSERQMGHSSSVTSFFWGQRR